MRPISVQEKEWEKVEEFRSFLVKLKEDDAGIHWPVFCYLKHESYIGFEYADRLLKRVYGHEIGMEYSKPDYTHNILYKHLLFLLDYMIEYRKNEERGEFVELEEMDALF